MTIGIVAALPSEATMFARLRAKGQITLAGGHRLVLAGMGPKRAADATRDLIETGVDGVVSWGSAAGLDPCLGAGRLIVPSVIVSANGTCFAVDDSWHHQLSDALGSKASATADASLAEAPSILKTPADKADLARHTGAAAADMESAAIADVAHQSGVPMLAVRAIADDAYTVLPPAAQAAVTPDGRLAPWQLLRALTNTHSGLHSELRSLKQTATSYRAAQRALTRASSALLARASP